MPRPCVHRVFASNGDGFLFDDRTGANMSLETKLTLSEFPVVSLNGCDERPRNRGILVRWQATVLVQSDYSPTY